MMDFLEVESYLPTADGLSPLARSKEWVNIKVGNDNFERETNTMPHDTITRSTI